MNIVGINFATVCVTDHVGGLGYICRRTLLVTTIVYYSLSVLLLCDFYTTGIFVRYDAIALQQ